jgi:hypothetical protein
MINCVGLMPEPAFELGKQLVLDQQYVSAHHTVTTVTCTETGATAIGLGCCLTLFNSKNEQVELEFEQEIRALCWDPKGTCLIVGDRSSCLHFINKDAVLLFSYSGLPKSSESNILSIVFLEGQPSSLLIAFDNGLVLEIPKVPLSSIAETFKAKPEMVIGAVSNLSHNKCSFQNQAIKKALFCSVRREEDKENVRSDLYSIVLDAGGSLASYPLGRQGSMSLDQHEIKEILPGQECLDTAIISGDMIVTVTKAKVMNESNLYLLSFANGGKETCEYGFTVNPECISIVAISTIGKIGHGQCINISLMAEESQIYTYCIVVSNERQVACFLLDQFKLSSAPENVFPLYEKNSYQSPKCTFFSRSQVDEKEMLSFFSLNKSVSSYSSLIAQGFLNEDSANSDLFFFIGSLVSGYTQFDKICSHIELSPIPSAVEPLLYLALYYGPGLEATEMSAILVASSDRLQAFYDSTGDPKILEYIHNLKLAEHSLETCLLLSEWSPESLLPRRSALQNRFYELMNGIILIFFTHTSELVISP